MEIREKYRILRFQKKIRFKELAGFMGCSVSQISNFENNHSGLSYDKLIKYMQYIDEHNNEKGDESICQLV
jgi:transcriptional regulator with XRE-family HTH domain